ncbi:MAG TPA: response regulator [Candidatus Eisenbergiella intestinipullorum]|nr:response regulator [Candidatus Eisenbergiella intestinipullorum]
MGEKIKLLLVDDESFLCEQISSNVSWESFGAELIGYCDNAMDALEQMIDEMPDILITDIRMPVMNGLELIARAKQMNPLLQCVILSGYAEFTLAQAALREGVQNYLLKPFSRAEQVGLGHDVPYFYQLFKRYTGMTPKEFRNS